MGHLLDLDELKKVKRFEVAHLIEAIETWKPGVCASIRCLAEEDSGEEATGIQ